MRIGPGHRRLATATATMVALVACVGAGASCADVVWLSAAADATLYEDATGSLANGAGSFMFAGATANGDARRALVRFDLSAIPSGATITGAALTLHMSRTATAAEQISLHRVLQAWGEGASVAPGEQGSGASPEPGDATWLHTYYAGSFWSMPGGDFAADPSSTALIVGNAFYTWESAQMVADAQSWVDDPASNAGWALIGEESLATTAKRFDTREHPDPAFRPGLRVEFVVVPEPASLVAVIAACLPRRRRA